MTAQHPPSMSADARGEHRFPYQTVLPYQVPEDEATRLLDDVKSGLSAHLGAGDWAGGARYLTRLDSYLQLKHPLAVEDRVRLVTLLYTTLVQPEVELSCADRYAATCASLLAHAYRVPLGALTLPWRPLYEKLRRPLQPKQGDWIMPENSTPIRNLKALPAVVSRYFDDNATNEVLEQFLPLCQTVEVTEGYAAYAWLTEFLPLDVVPAQDGPPSWLPTLVSLWADAARSHQWYDLSLALLGRLAQSHIVRTGSQPFFRPEWLDWTYNMALRACALPMGNQSTMQAASMFRHDTGNVHITSGTDKLAFSKLAIWTIRTDELLRDAPGPDSVPGGIIRLERFFRIVESYLHPSNHGRWSETLAAHLFGCSHILLTRMRMEADDERYGIPAACKLTSDMRRRIVLALRPSLLLSIFSKNRNVVDLSHKALRCLAWVDPDAIIPAILGRVVPSLESLTETHRTTSMIQCLQFIARPMLSREHYPQGGKYLATLLELTLPGLDANDQDKCIATAMFIFAALSGVPIRELSSDAQGFIWDGTAVDTLDDAPGLDRAIEDGYCKAVTLELGDWALRCIARIIAVLETPGESVEHDVSGRDKPSSGGWLVGSILQAAYTLFTQLSPELLQLAVDQLVRHVRDEVQTVAAENIAFLCQFAVEAAPELAFAPFFNLCDERIREELQHGAGSHSSSKHSDAALHWYMSVLSAALMQGGHQLLAYRTRIMDLILTLSEHCHSKRSTELLQEVLRCVLHSCTSSAPDCTAMSRSDRLDGPSNEEHHMHWHHLKTLADLKVQWHVPTAEHISFALDLLRAFLVPSTQRLQTTAEAMRNGSDNDRALMDEVEHLLAIVYGCLLGTNDLATNNEPAGDADDAFMTPSEGDDNISRRLHHWESQPRRIVAGYALRDIGDPRLTEYHTMCRQLMDTLHGLVGVMLSQRESSVSCMKRLIKTIQLSLTHSEGDSYRKSQIGYTITKSIFSTPLDRKQLPITALYERAYILHMLRIKHNRDQIQLLPIHQQLVDDVVHCAISNYSETRKEAQKALSTILRCFPRLKGRVVGHIMNTLTNEAATTSTLKGAFHLLKERRLLLHLVNVGHGLPRIAAAIRIVQREEKPSINMLVLQVLLLLCSMSPGKSKRVTDSPIVQSLAKQLVDEQGLVVDVAWRETVHETAIDRSAGAKLRRDETMDALIDGLQSGVYRATYQSLVLNILVTMQRTEYSPTRALVGVATKYIASELPQTRFRSMLLLYLVMRIIKKRSWAHTEHPLKRTIALPDPLPADFTQQYMQRCQPSEDTVQWSLQDNNAIGITVWPRSLLVRQFADQFLYPTYLEANSLECYQDLQTLFSSTEFWQRLMSYIAEERDQGTADAVQQNVMDFYGMVMQMFGASAFAALVPTLTTLLSEPEQSSKQRAAAEIIAGTISGSKHWPSDARTNMWSVLLPLLDKAFDDATPDTITYWRKAITYTAHKRDPRRLAPLIELVLQRVQRFDAESHAAFGEFKKITLASGLLEASSWTLREAAAETLLPLLLAHLHYPYQQVRGEIGLLVQLLWEAWPRTTFASVEARIEHDVKLVGKSSPVTDGAERIVPVARQLAVWYKERRPAADGSSDYANGGKTLMTWLLHGLLSMSAQATLETIPILLPEVLHMQDISDDEDLRKRAINTLHLIATFPYQHTLSVSILDAFLRILNESDSWHTRSRVLPLLQLLFFKQLFVLGTDRSSAMLQAITGALEDSRVEVRLSAAAALSGLVRCSTDGVIDQLQATCSSFLATALPRRKTSTAPEKAAGQAELIRKRHAGVLGLSSLVLAFPYEVPSWMPNVLIQLSRCLSDPDPIQTTVRKTFADFKRTHQDTWHEDSLQFTEEQKEQLMDVLVSPSYYA